MPFNLTPELGLIFRITHIRNLPWLLMHGLHCANATHSDPDFVAIGNADLIGNRRLHRVPIAPGGTLADYVPFYFTPKSPMLLNIKTGFSGVTIRRNEEIIILVSSAAAMAAQGVTTIFTDRHAYTKTAAWSGSYDHVSSMIDWDILRRHDFARNDRYPDKMERYQAEALAYRHVPPDALLGIGCCSDTVATVVAATAAPTRPGLRTVTRREWFFW